MKSNKTIDRYGNIKWLNDKGELHREDGPAAEFADGSKEWWVNGESHREDGPAYEGADGTKQWWVNGRLHREDGPACEYADGSKDWYLNGELHRLDGPAIEDANGSKEWWMNGKQFTEKKFLQILQTGFAEPFSSIIEEKDLDPTAIYKINGVYYRLGKTKKIKL